MGTKIKGVEHVMVRVRQETYYAECEANDARLETTLTPLTDSEVLVPHGVESDDALAHLALQVVEPEVRQELHVRVHRQVRC